MGSFTCSRMPLGRATSFSASGTRNACISIWNLKVNGEEDLVATSNNSNSRHINGLTTIISNARAQLLCLLSIHPFLHEKKLRLIQSLRAAQLATASELLASKLICAKHKWDRTPTFRSSVPLSLELGSGSMENAPPFHLRSTNLIGLRESSISGNTVISPAVFREC